MRRRPAGRLRAALLLVAAACTRAPTPPPGPPPEIARVAVAPPTNHTGNPLTLDQHGRVTLVLPPKHDTVPDVLGFALRSALQRHRFDVGTATGPPAPLLHVDLRRWDTDEKDWSAVTVDLTATLVEPGTARALWSASRTGWVVPTPGATSRPAAWVAAARAVADGLVANWRPAKAEPPAK
jgi:hypothetical protein